MDTIEILIGIVVSGIFALLPFLLPKKIEMRTKAILACVIVFICIVIGFLLSMSMSPRGGGYLNNR